MNNRRYGRGAATHSFLGGVGAAASGDFIGVFGHAANMSSAMRQSNNVRRVQRSPEAMLAQQQLVLLVKLQQGKKRLQAGKEKLHFLLLGPITATVPELEALETRAREADSWDQVKPLISEVQVALGYKGGLDSLDIQVGNPAVFMKRTTRAYDLDRRCL
jgi:hypothetical protein